jgi:hypothetical protein
MSTQHGTATCHPSGAQNLQEVPRYLEIVALDIDFVSQHICQYAIHVLHSTKSHYGPGLPL